MSFTSNILVVANRTAGSAGLQEALRARLQSAPAIFTLVVPLGYKTDADLTAQEMAARLRAAGLDVCGRAGDGDPLNAVLEVWSPAVFDEIIVSTLPASTSRWMQAGLLRRIERHTGALVHHVEVRDAPAFASVRTLVRTAV